MNLPHAVIAGAGIGGLCTSLCLARGGWRVSLYEKAKVLEETGAGLQLSPNASAILGRLGVIARLTPYALRPKAIRIRRARDGATLAAMPLDDAERRWGAPYFVVHRADLQRALLEAIARESNIKLQTGAAVAGFASGENSVAVAVKQGAVRLKTAGDCLIGADGVRSFVRQRLGAECARFSGRTAWRAIVAASHVPAELRRDETTLWLGRKAHLVHYPLRGGAVVNVVAIVDEDFRPDGADFWSSPGDRSFLEARFSCWAEAARDLLRVAPDWRKWPLFDCNPIASWVAGRVALMGDAAHPMLPFLAQGAAQAIEDAGALGEVLTPGQNIEKSLRAYQEARHARATRVQKESRTQATIYHLGGPAALLRDMALRALGPQKMLARYDWLYDAHKASGHEG
jgi:2-polyprenyl-6-methoxyphenol hydroxylase-like FAD-dependent oxidoreductase